MEQSRRGRLLVLIVVAAALAIGAALLLRPGRSGAAVEPAARPLPGEQGGRVVTEVLNASGQVGLARSATRRLRDAGIDVVYFGNDEAAGLDSTEVLVRRGAEVNGRRVAAALGTGAVRPAPDAGRLVDVTVRLGRDFARLGLVGEP